MEYIPPKPQGDNPVCKECRLSFPHVYKECNKACSHLISWAVYEAKFAVLKEMAKPPYDGVGGD